MLTAAYDLLTYAKSIGCRSNSSYYSIDHCPWEPFHNCQIAHIRNGNTAKTNKFYLYFSFVGSDEASTNG